MLDLDHECRTPKECKRGRIEPSVSDPVLGDPDLGPDETDEEEEIEQRTYKDDSVLVDQQSTGRKRAAAAYPLDKDALCEWHMKKNCGGGKFPIVGCLANSQQARHHGPNKNTLANEPGNVHRICHQCHNRWHTLNDPDYVWGAIHDLHDPRPANGIDIGMNEEFWKDRKLTKPEH